MTSTKIMIVEDESIVALDIKARLVRAGYHVVGIAISGEEAIELAASTQPEIALMDVRLKGSMDGVETAEHLRQRFGLPVVYLTAYTDDNTLARAKITEPFGYIVKPFQERELLSALEMALYKAKTSKQLREQALRLQQIVSTVPEGLVLLDKNSCVLMANARAQDFLTVLSGAGVGEPVTRLGALPISQFLSTPPNETWHEIQIQGPPKHFFEVSATPIHSSANPATNTKLSQEWVLVIRDVTKERELQQRIQLQERLAAVGQLAAGIAHDFNNIISGVMLSAELIPMTEPDLSPKIHEHLDTIYEQAKRARDLIKQIVDFSRSSANELHPLDLVPLLKELTKLLERTLPESIRLELSYQPSEYLINGDATRILQLLMNLALNARDAMPHGGILRIEFTRLAGGSVDLPGMEHISSWVQIRVSDNGMGIEPDVMPRIFEPFFTTKAAGHGTGLGLSQVYGIVRQHQGHIDVHSEVGKGSTFSIFIPALVSVLSSKSKPKNDKREPEKGNQQTVLIVEDSTSVRLSIARALELLDYRVLTASNGLEALSVMQGDGISIDLVVSDLIMPDMGGLDLVKQIRQGPHSDMRVVILTGHASDEILDELKGLAITELVQKPVDIGLLSQVIRQALLS